MTVTTKTTAAKAPNYTAAQVETMLALWAEREEGSDQKAVVESIATTIGKTARSIVAKLSKEGVYTPKAYVSKTGEKPVKKDAHADAIGAILLLSEAETESLTKANKTALAKIFAALANSKPLANGEDRAGENAPSA